jgi:integrase/recombinase XerD
MPYEERIVPHSLRHSYATRLLKKGIAMPKVSRLLGHASIQVTVDVYGHLKMKELKEAVRLAEL